MPSADNAIGRPLMPHEYEFVYAIIACRQPLAARLLAAATEKGRQMDWTGREVAPKLRELVYGGWLIRGEDGRYEVTDAARRMVAVGGPREKGA